VQHGPGDAIVLAGINDIASGRSLSTIQANLAATYSHLKAQGYRVIAVTLTPWGGYSRFTPAMGEKQRQLNAWLRTKPEGVDCVVDVYPHFSTPNGVLLSQYDSGDHLHLNNVGQVELGREIARQAYGLQVIYAG
jgi:lysophospholipase L1-like esterase